MTQIIICPNCNTEHEVEYYAHGECTCGWSYYWDDGWDYENEEWDELLEGFLWEP